MVVCAHAPVFVLAMRAKLLHFVCVRVSITLFFAAFFIISHVTTIIPLFLMMNALSVCIGFSFFLFAILPVLYTQFFFFILHFQNETKIIVIIDFRFRHPKYEIKLEMICFDSMRIYNRWFDFDENRQRKRRNKIHFRSITPSTSETKKKIERREEWMKKLINIWPWGMGKKNKTMAATVRRCMPARPFTSIR